MCARALSPQTGGTRAPRPRIILHTRHFRPCSFTITTAFAQDDGARGELGGSDSLGCRTPSLHRLEAPLFESICALSMPWQGLSFRTLQDRGVCKDSIVLMQCAKTLVHVVAPLYIERLAGGCRRRYSHNIECMEHHILPRSKHRAKGPCLYVEQGCMPQVASAYSVIVENESALAGFVKKTLPCPIITSAAYSMATSFPLHMLLVLLNLHVVIPETRGHKPHACLCNFEVIGLAKMVLHGSQD